MSSLRRSWRCVRLSEAWGLTWRLADASPHEVASLNVRRSKANSHRHNAPHFACLCPKTQLLCLQSVKRRLEQGPQWLVVALFVFGVHFLSQLVVSVRNGCDLQLRRSKSGGSSKRVFRLHLTVDEEGTVTTTVSATTFREVRKDYLLAVHVCSRRASL